MGGNAAKGDYIVFLDAHCRVSPRWLETPYKLISEVVLMMVCLIGRSHYRELCRFHSRRRLQREASFFWDRKVVLCVLSCPALPLSTSRFASSGAVAHRTTTTPPSRWACSLSPNTGGNRARWTPSSRSGEAKTWRFLSEHGCVEVGLWWLVTPTSLTTSAQSRPIR